MAKFDELTVGQHENPDAFEEQFASVVEVFQEIFDLLGEYAPLWYTEEHHRRAVAALGALEEFRQLSKAASRTIPKGR